MRAYEQTTATPLWRARLVTFDDPKTATAVRSPRVIGSATAGSLLGQEGDRVWLQIAEPPRALAVRDGSLRVDAAAIEAANPELAGRLPSEARFHGFDGGGVVHAADARRWVPRGPAIEGPAVDARRAGDGASSRRSFWTVQTAQVRRLDERWRDGRAQPRPRTHRPARPHEAAAPPRRRRCGRRSSRQGRLAATR